MIPTQNLEFECGDDVEFVVGFFVDDFEETQVPLSDLSEIRFAIREAWGETPVFVATLGSNVSPYGDAEALIEIPSTFTSLANPEIAYRYDVEVVTVSGKTNTTQRGYLTARPSK